MSRRRNGKHLFPLHENLFFFEMVGRMTIIKKKVFSPLKSLTIKKVYKKLIKYEQVNF